MKTVKEKIEIFKKANIETLLELENLLPELELYELAYCVRLAYKEKNTLSKISSTDTSEESKKLGVDINQMINDNFEDLIISNKSMYEVEFIDYMSYPGSEFSREYKKYKANSKKEVLRLFHNDYKNSDTLVKGIKKLY